MPGVGLGDNSKDLQRRLRDALGTFLTGITVVTTTDQKGRSRGFTANSFTSVSLDPPLVLVCIDRSASSYEAFTAGSTYAVNILGQESRGTAELFASKRPDKFSETQHCRSPLGNLLLDDAVTWLDCRTTDIHVMGDHAVLIGMVEDFGGAGGQPLGFHQGHYVSFSAIDSPEVPAVASGTVDVEWILEGSQGRVVLERVAEGGLSLPSQELLHRDLTDEGLAGAAHKKFGGRVLIDFLYSFYTDPSSGRMVVVYRGRLERDELVSPCEWVCLTDEAIANLVDHVEASVISRYRTEQATGRFGIYAGTSERGTVATIHGVRPD